MSIIKKTIAGFAIALSLVAVVAATPAKAMTESELMAAIASLQAQLSAAQGGSSMSASYTFTRNLTIGSSGADVTALQNFLIGKGYGIPAGATGYFGGQTKAALASYQAAKGIAPAVGYFGPTTRASVQSVMSVVVPTGPTNPSNPSSPSTNLAGTDGTISDVDTLSQYSSEEVGEGEEDVKIAGFEVEASSDGDIALRSIKVSFDQTGNDSGDSDHLDDYISGVKVWMGDKEVGSADVDDFNEESDDTFSKTITLSNSVVREDDTEKFYISVDAVNSFDSTDIDSDSWTVAVETIRFEDGSGVVTSDTTTGDLGAAGTGIGTDGTAGDGVPMAFVSFSTAANTELKFSTASDTPIDGVVVIDETDSTDDVVLTKGKIKLEGTSDVVLDELPVTLTSTGAGIVGITGSLKLSINGDEYTETVSSSTIDTLATTGLTGTITFDNLNITLDAGQTYTFSILADINDTDAATLNEGSTLKASVTSTNNDYVDAENEEGDQLTDDTEKTGTVTGKVQEFRTEGIQVVLVGTPTATSNNSDGEADTGTFTIKFKVKAIGETVYVASIAANATNDTVYDSSGTATSADTMTRSLVNNTDTSKTSVGNYEIEDGEEETFTLTIVVPNGAGDAEDQYYAALTGVLWDTTDDTSPANTYTSNLDEFQTPAVNLDNA